MDLQGPPHRCTDLIISRGTGASQMSCFPSPVFPAEKLRGSSYFASSASSQADSLKTIRRTNLLVGFCHNYPLE